MINPHQSMDSTYYQDISRGGSPSLLRSSPSSSPSSQGLMGTVGLVLAGVIVEYVVPELPAALNSLIDRGDVVLSVDGVPATDASVLSLIRGPVGSFTQIVFRKADGSVFEAWLERVPLRTRMVAPTENSALFSKLQQLQQERDQLMQQTMEWEKIAEKLRSELSLMQHADRKDSESNELLRQEVDFLLKNKELLEAELKQARNDIAKLQLVLTDLQREISIREQQYWSDKDEANANQHALEEALRSEVAKSEELSRQLTARLNELKHAKEAEVQWNATRSQQELLQNKLTSELEKSVSDKEVCMKQMRELEAELREAKAAMGTLQRQLAEYVDLEKTQNQQISLVTSQKLFLESQLKDTISRNDQERESTVAHIKTLEQQLQLETSAKIEAQNHLAESTQECQSLIHTLGQAQTRYSALENIHEATQSRCESLQADNSNLQNELAKLKQEAKTAKAELEEANRLRGLEASRMEGYKAELERAQQQLKEAQAEMVLLSNEAHDTNTVASSLREQLQAANQQKAQSQLIVDTMTKTLETQKAEISALKEQLDASTKNAQKYLREWRDHQSRIYSAVDTLSSGIMNTSTTKDDSNESMEHSMQLLVHVVETAVRHHQQLQHDVEHHKMEKDALAHKLATVHETNNLQIESLNAEVRTLSEALEHIQSRQTQTQAANDEEAQALRTRLEMSQMTNMELNSRLKQMEDSLIEEQTMSQRKIDEIMQKLEQGKETERYEQQIEMLVQKITHMETTYPIELAKTNDEWGKRQQLWTNEMHHLNQQLQKLTNENADLLAKLNEANNNNINKEAADKAREMEFALNQALIRISELENALNEAHCHIHETSTEVRGAVGVGLIIAQSSSAEFRVQNLVTGTSAHRCGLIAAGDEVVAVDGLGLAGLTLPQVKDQIRGKLGTKVSLKIRKDNGRIIDVVLTRGEEIETVTKSAEKLLLNSPNSNGNTQSQDLHSSLTFSNFVMSPVVINNTNSNRGVSVGFTRGMK